MKKLTNGNTWDNDLANKIDELIDEHEKLKAEVKAMGDALVTHYNAPTAHNTIEELDKATLRPKLVDSIPDYTHRTVTLRIPERLTITEALWEARIKSDICDNFWEFSDTDLQKALDELKGEKK